MSLAIDTDKITEVMLPDGWHTVAKGSFSLDAYEYIRRQALEGRLIVLGREARFG